MAVIILDGCSGSDGTAVAGRTPDTTNTPGGAWAGSANWTIQSNRMRCGSSSLSIANIQASEANPTVTATVNAPTGASVGIILRYVDDSNFILALYGPGSGGSFTIFKRVAGTFTSIANTTINTTAGTDHTLVFSATSGNLLTATLDGVSPISATDAAGSTNTKVGIYSNSGSLGLVDDFQVASGAAAGTAAPPSLIHSQSVYRASSF